MDWLILYKIIFFMGLIITVLSLFIRENRLYMFINGLIIILSSLLEQWDIKRLGQVVIKKEPLAPQIQEKPVTTQINIQPVINQPITPKVTTVNYQKYSEKNDKKEQKISNPATKPKFFGLFRKKETEKPQLPKIEAPYQKKPQLKKEILKDQYEPPEGISVFKTESDKKKILVEYIKKAIRSNFPKDKIKEAATMGGWPGDLFEEAYSEIIKSHKKIKIFIALGLLIFVAFFLFIMVKLEIFILPYLIKNLRYMSPMFYLGILIILIIFVMILTVKIRKSLKKKKVEYKVEEEKNVQEIKEALIKFSGTYETDLDKLYKILAEKQKLTISEVAKAFSISKSEAEEWGKIMRDHDLITMHYPTVGDPELIWKKLKSIQ